MTLPEVDPDGVASTAAAEGKFVLAAGDTPRARERYEHAGRLLEEQIASARGQADKHLLRFLAASQYYHGGHYEKALKLCRRVELRLLPVEVKHLFEPFFRDVKKRASKDYSQEVRDALLKLWLAGRHADVLEMLKNHPYVLDAPGLAFLRAVECEELKQYKAAALFYATAVQYAPDASGLLFMTAALPLVLPSQGRLDEAWEYVRYQLEVLPNAVTYISASIVCFNRSAAVPEGEERRAILREQVGYFEKAWRAFQHLPEMMRQNHDLRGFMSLCFNAAALALWKLGEKERAKQVCDAAIEFNPSDLSPQSIRGAITYPSEQALTDLKEAAERGDESCMPYYFLAHDAMNRNDLRAAREWIEKALKYARGMSVEAQLHSWLAVCADLLGSPAEEVNALFKKALAIDPRNKEVMRLYRLFQSAELGDQPKPKPTFNYSAAHDLDVGSVIDAYRNAPITDRMKSVRRTLQPVGA